MSEKMMSNVAAVDMLRAYLMLGHPADDSVVFMREHPRAFAAAAALTLRRDDQNGGHLPPWAFHPMEEAEFTCLDEKGKTVGYVRMEEIRRPLIEGHVPAPFGERITAVETTPGVVHHSRWATVDVMFGQSLDEQLAVTL